MVTWFLASVALAQTTVVALGDGPVAGSGGASAQEVSGGWVAVLADCLEERAPHAYHVVDRAQEGETAKTALGRVESVRELDPALVVLGVGAREISDPATKVASFREEVARLVGELRRGRKVDGVLLLGLVPSAAAPALPSAAAPAPVDDARVAEWNAALAELAKATEGVRMVDLSADWPRDSKGRAALTQEPQRLTDQGHARVAAAVCDTIVAHWPAAVSGGK